LSHNFSRVISSCTRCICSNPWPIQSRRFLRHCHQREAHCAQPSRGGWSAQQATELGTSNSSNDFSCVRSHIVRTLPADNTL